MLMIYIFRAYRDCRAPLPKPVMYLLLLFFSQEAEKWLRLELALADMTGCMYCVKLVRGAYMEQERERAEQNGYPDPIWPDKASTDKCYHKLMELLMQEKTARDAPVHFMVASHNEATVTAAIEKYVHVYGCIYTEISPNLVLRYAREYYSHI